jgi:hypothetical protein
MVGQSVEVAEVGPSAGPPIAFCKVRCRMWLWAHGILVTRELHKVVIMGCLWNSGIQ